MSLIHDVIKIKYVDEGYLPYYPYHLISDDEMFEAFALFFSDYYPCPSESLEYEYSQLRDKIFALISKRRSNEYVEVSEYDKISKMVVTKEVLFELPNWVYSYMIGEVINDFSNEKDKHDLFLLLNLDNTYDSFNETIYKSIYDVSKSYLGKICIDTTSKADYELRPPTVFGEPHVIKALRLNQYNA